MFLKRGILWYFRSGAEVLFKMFYNWARVSEAPCLAVTDVILYFLDYGAVHRVLGEGQGGWGNWSYAESVGLFQCFHTCHSLLPPGVGVGDTCACPLKVYGRGVSTEYNVHYVPCFPLSLTPAVQCLPANLYWSHSRHHVLQAAPT